ncbi:MAG: chemotaxis protein CheW [Myxococcota bacterium]
MSPAGKSNDDRLLTFEIAGALFAMPITGVLEVAERTGSARIPTVPESTADVMNYRGDALPVVRRERLLDLPAEPDADESEHVLVVTDPGSPVPRMGMGVDRVLGLVDGSGAASTDGSVIAERRPMDGRMACVLDPARLVARAREVVEGSLGRE